MGPILRCERCGAIVPIEALCGDQLRHCDCLGRLVFLDDFDPAEALQALPPDERRRERLKLLG